MKIAIDVSPLHSAHQYRGIGSYTRNLIEALKEIDKENRYVTALEDPDIIHYPYFDFFQTSLPINKTKPTIVTICDTIPLLFPKAFPTGIRGRIIFQIQKRSLKTVNAVITISNNSKKDIIKYLGIPEEKIFVTYLAPGKEFKKIAIKQKNDFPNNFVLYVGDVNWNKNIPGLIKAFSLLKNKDLKLVLAGRAFKDDSLKETEQIIQLIKQLNLDERVIRFGWLSEQDLVEAYNLAAVYCQPSYYEGFGLPVLEAMACGCPVVAANNSSLPEICQGAAVMAHAGDVSNISLGIEKALVNREKLIAKGFLQIKKFSWPKTARETLSVYTKVYEKSSRK